MSAIEMTRRLIWWCCVVMWCWAASYCAKSPNHAGLFGTNGATQDVNCWCVVADFASETHSILFSLNLHSSHKPDSVARVRRMHWPWCFSLTKDRRSYSQYDSKGAVVGVTHMTCTRLREIFLWDGSLVDLLSIIKSLLCSRSSLKASTVYWKRSSQILD